MPFKPGNQLSKRHGLYTGTLPKGCGWIARACNDLRREIEALAIEVRGRLSIVEESGIDAACKWHRHCLLAARWLKDEYDKLSPDQRLNFSREVARAAESRDRILRGMGLHIATPDVLDVPFADSTDDQPTDTPAPSPETPKV